MHPVYNLSHEAQHSLELASHPSSHWVALSRCLRAPNPGALWLPFLLLVSVCLGISDRWDYRGGLFSGKGLGSCRNGVIILHSWRVRLQCPNGTPALSPIPIPTTPPLRCLTFLVWTSVESCLRRP